MFSTVAKCIFLCILVSNAGTYKQNGGTQRTYQKLNANPFQALNEKAKRGMDIREVNGLRNPLNRPHLLPEGQSLLTRKMF